MSYQEKIINEVLRRDFEESANLPIHHLTAVRDCFTIQRLQQNISNFGSAAIFDPKAQKSIAEYTDEITQLLAKYNLKP